MANLNTALTPAPVVTVVNKDGTTATGYTGNVTMALGTNPTNATLGGTTVVAASSGVATFSNLTLNRSGKDFKLLATAAVSGGNTPRTRVSSAFTISTQLVFTTQPSSTQPDTTFTVEVTAQDTAGTTDTSYTGAVTIAIYTSDAAGVLSGTLTQTAVAGVATFTGLSVDLEGTYTLFASGAEVATAYPPAPAVSNSFSIEVFTAPDIIVQSSGNAILGFNFDGSNSHLYTNPLSVNTNIIANVGTTILSGNLSASSAASVLEVGATEITLVQAPGYNLGGTNAVIYNSSFLVFDQEFTAIASYTSLDGQYIGQDGTLGSVFSNSLAVSSFVTGAGLPTVCQTVSDNSNAIIFDNGGGSLGDPSLIVASLNSDFSDEREYQSALQTSPISQIAYEPTNFYVFRCLASTNSPSIEVGSLGGSIVTTVTTLEPFSAASSAEYVYGPICCNSTYLFVIVNDKTVVPSGVGRLFRYALSDWSVTELTNTVNNSSALLGAVTFIDRSRMLILSN